MHTTVIQYSNRKENTGPWNSFDTLANCKEVKIDKIYIFMAKTLQNRRKI